LASRKFFYGPFFALANGLTLLVVITSVVAFIVDAVPGHLLHKFGEPAACKYFHVMDAQPLAVFHEAESTSPPGHLPGKVPSGRFYKESAIL